MPCTPGVRAHGGKCRDCWKRVHRREPPLRAGERYRPRPGADARASLGWYRQLDQEWDRALGLRWRPSLLLLPDGPPATLAAWPGVELLGADRIAELTPGLAPVAAGLLAHDQAQVHPLRLAAVLARRAGSVATGTAMVDAEVAGGRIVRVRTTTGDLWPGVVVFATGLAPERWVRLPQRLVKGHLVATEPGRFGLPCGVHAPGLGIGPTGDGQPVIDRVPGIGNAWVSAGHDGTGLLLAAATGQAIATWIATGTRPEQVDSFGLSRFGQPGPS
jgi:glycine/D-amino acid oxidase-like deaminating enzyme